jgi:quercetin 2,3-dioxygenase
MAMPHARGIAAKYAAHITREGAGVRLRRAFGFPQMPLFDPFLMLDDFRSSEPAHYRRGFPWHPHRGIETVTYLLRGSIEHADSLGNKGVIGSGCAQWMTAGGGIVHQEMPVGDDKGVIEGFQLWLNLPAAHKMIKPTYQQVSSDEIPLLFTDDGVAIHVIAGSVGGVAGPVQGIVTEPEYLDITVPPHTRYEHETVPGHTVFAYVISGSGCFAGHGRSNEHAFDGSAVLFDDGGAATVKTDDDPVRFLLCSARPLHEPVAWGGPIVMNSQEELDDAFAELREGTFIRGETK